MILLLQQELKKVLMKSALLQDMKMQWLQQLPKEMF